jgi:peptide/nickel transport system ATP-binding protein
MNQPILDIQDLHVTFPGDVRAVAGLTLTLAPGEVVGLVGESGSGKSATALAILGLLPPAARVSGSVRLEGEELLGLDDAALARRRGARIAMVFQDPQSAFTPVYSIGDQVAEAVRAHARPARAEARRRAAQLLDLVGIPAARARAFPHEFSGGMLQRAMIAMAVANDPAVLVADEPTTALDVTVQAQVLDVLARAREETGAALLLVTHDLGVIAETTDRVAVMYAGRVVESAPVHDLFRNPRMPYTIGLLAATPRLDTDHLPAPIDGAPPSPAARTPGCAFAPRCPHTAGECTTHTPPLRPLDVRWLGGALSVEQGNSHRPPPWPLPSRSAVLDEAGLAHWVACARQETVKSRGGSPVPVGGGSRRAAPGEGRMVLEVEGLVRHFAARVGTGGRKRVVRAVDGIGFEVREGETLALVGESGCGKTTTLLEILALTAPQAGRIRVLGSDTSRLSGKARRELRKHVQPVLQDPLGSLDPRMPVADLLAEPLRTHGVGRREARERVHELLGLVGLAETLAGRFPRELSGGQRQRVGIARALALRPRLVVLDEPLSALDVSVRAGIMRLLVDLRAGLGLSYLMVAHDLAVVRHLADRVAVMYLGRLVEVGATGRVYAAPAHPYTRALLSAVPLPDPILARRRRTVLAGDPPSAIDPPPGCAFHPRCPLLPFLDSGERRRCVSERPGLRAAAGGGFVACHHTGLESGEG